MTYERQYPEMECFVLMPFGRKEEYADQEDEANFIYHKIILPALKDALPCEVNDSTVVREIDKRVGGAINNAIIERIYEAPTVIVDITGYNANVFFELGIRYAFSKTGTILIGQPGALPPFDLVNYRCHTYHKYSDTAATELAQVIRANRDPDIRKTDSLVYQTFPNLSVSIASQSRMPWDDYWKKISHVQKLLCDAWESEVQKPDVVIGISNGGGAVADLLTLGGKIDVPVVMLWADRNETDFFKNKINIGMLSGIKESMASLERRMRVLLIDDIVSSGNTFRQAIEFIANNLLNCDIDFLPLVYKDDKNYKNVESRLIWKREAFSYQHQEIEDIHLSKYSQLPYLKSIRST